MSDNDVATDSQPATGEEAKQTRQRSTVALVTVMTRRAGALLRHYRDRGSVRAIKDPRRSQFDLWEIAI